MATEVPNHPEPSVTALVSGIVNDMQDLFKQQLRLTRKEIEADLRKSKEAASLFVFGCVIALVGAFGLCLMLAHLINWLGLPAGESERSHVPMWASYAIAAFVFLIGGGLTILAGKKRMDSMGVPLHETAQALKENIEWKTKTS